jgi:hypothetical protein
MTSKHRSAVYSVLQQEGRFNVCARSGQVIMTCGDAASAAHYASLLKQAHDAGYKQGFRDGRSV